MRRHPTRGGAEASRRPRQHPSHSAAPRQAANWGNYLETLNTNPIVTKGLTSAFVYTIGDGVAQVTEGAKFDEIDRTRVARNMVAGGLGHGPLSHFWYMLCDAFFTDVLGITQW